MKFFNSYQRNTHSACLVNNRFDKNDIFSLMFKLPLLSLLQQYTGLRKLDLSHNNLGDVGARILGKAIGMNDPVVFGIEHLN